MRDVHNQNFQSYFVTYGICAIEKRVSNLKVICELNQNKLLFRYESKTFLVLDKFNG